MLAKTILLVDDDPDIREIVRIVLEDQGRTIFEAGTGIEGLQIAKQELPDLIILDWMMPGMEGIDVARALGRETETGGIPIIMLTSRDADSDFEQSREAGVFAYLVKPFSPLQLVNTVDSALEPNGQNP
jgi:two-component system phosphate regulon response regulator PhoB